MKGITGVPVTINSITVPTVANQNPMYGMAVNARSVERQRTHSAMTAFASTVGRARSLGVMRESARNFVWSIAVAAALLLPESVLLHMKYLPKASLVYLLKMRRL